MGEFPPKLGVNTADLAFAAGFLMVTTELTTVVFINVLPTITLEPTNPETV